MRRARPTRAAMAALALAAVVAACAPSPAPSLPPGAGHEGLRVMTYNLLGVNGDTAVYDEHRGWAARVDQLGPDIVVLQEAQSDDVAAIRDLTSTGYTLASYLEWGCDIKPQREGVAILVRSSLTTLGGGGTHVGTSCFDPAVARVLVWADVQVAGAPLRIYSTHLTAGGAAGDASRLAQIRRIKALIAEHDPADARRWLLTGDLNFVAGSTSYRLTMGDLASDPAPYRYVDTFAEVHPHAADPALCPAVDEDDAAAMAFLLANPDHVRDCGYTAGWAKDDNWLACNLLSLCVAWELRRDTSVRSRIDYVLRPEGGPVAVIDGFVPNRADADWAAPGAEWFRLADHLPYVVDLDVAPLTQ